VLRFGEDAYLNPYAEVFRPAAALPGLELPQVGGPAGSEKLLLERFDAFTELLEPSGLRIARLALRRKHAWRITSATAARCCSGGARSRTGRIVSRLLAATGRRARSIERTGHALQQWRGGGLEGGGAEGAQAHGAAAGSTVPAARPPIH